MTTVLSCGGRNQTQRWIQCALSHHYYNSYCVHARKEKEWMNVKVKWCRGSASVWRKDWRELVFWRKRRDWQASLWCCNSSRVFSVSTKMPKRVKKSEADAVVNDKDAEEPKKKKSGDGSNRGGSKTTTPKERVLLQRSYAPRPQLQIDDGSERYDEFKVISWNIAGLRSFFTEKESIDTKSDTKLNKLVKLWNVEKPDLLCLAEHKLQEQHCEEAEVKLREALGLDGITDDVQFIWNCSTAKKGYSGVCCILRKRIGNKIGVKSALTQKSISSFFSGSDKSVKKRNKEKSDGAVESFHPLGYSSGIQKDGKKLDTDYNNEGRVITVEYNHLYVVTAYVPNSGDGLKRLEYRLDTWESDMNAYLVELDKQKPVLYIGDLNVAYLDIDIWNVDAKHIPKSAGTTPQERQAFRQLLNGDGQNDGDGRFFDGFRHFHEHAEHWYSYWSVRANNNVVNRGLRLDYTIVSKKCLTTESCVKLIDAFILPEVVIDHCPVGATFQKRN